MKKITLKAFMIALTLVSTTQYAHAADFARIATGTVGGGFYTSGTGVVSVLNSVKNGVNYSSITGGSIKNLIQLEAGKVEFGFSLTSTLFEAWNGTGPFKQPLKKLRYCIAIYPQVAHIIVAKNINSISDLRGKRVDFGPIGGGIDTNARFALTAYGIDPEKEINIQRNSRAETAEGFETGTTDAQILLTAYPGAAVFDMLQKGAKLIGVDKEHLDKILHEYPCYVPWTIPADTYEGYSESIPTYSAFCVMYASEDLSEELVYKTVKALVEGTKDLKERGAIFDFFGPENAMAGCSIPLHPGAERYYKEAGLLK